MINKLVEKIKKTGAPIVVGLDPMLSYIPQHILDKAYAEYGETLEGAAEAVWQFNKEIVDKTYDLIPAVKPQIAMYEQFGIPGLMAYKNTIDYCKEKNDLLGKPWVAIHTDYDEQNDPDNLMVEVVYNKTFISNMRKKGLPGDTDEEIAEQWLKLFFMANMDLDDITSMLDENESEEEKRYLTKRKLGDNTILMG